MATGSLSHRKHRGLTLIEILIVVVIIGTLLAVALPGYQGSLQKTRRADAKETLLEVANRQEQHMLDQTSYTTNMLDLGFAEDPALSDDQHYTVDAKACDSGSISTCFILEASPSVSSSQTKDKKCTKFILDSAGNKTAEGSDNSNCW